MIVAGYLLAAIVLVGGILWLLDRRHATVDRTAADSRDAAAGESLAAPDNIRTNEDDSSESECCGMHVVCEKDSLLTAVDTTLLYYEDEELDRFSQRDPAAYNEAEIEEFRDVLLSLRSDELAGWGRSLQQRCIELPVAVRDEFLLMIAEQRNA